MQRLETMLPPIQRALQQDRTRLSASGRSRPAAVALSQRFPLVHRSVIAGGARLPDLLTTRRLLARPPCTSREANCGIERALYFFLGCAAYPEGSVAFLADSSVLLRTRATYTPFDTGSLERHANLREAAFWSDGEKEAFLAAHLGHGEDALSFSAEYIAAHFNAPIDYVRRHQRSEPDFPTYHGLQSNSGDRRAWSIEVQVHADLPLDAQHVDAIILGQPDLLADIPDDLVEKVVIAEAEGSITPMIHRLMGPLTNLWVG